MKKFIDEKLKTKNGDLNTAKIKNHFEWIKKHYPKEYEIINDFSKHFSNLTEGQILYLLYNNLKTIPKCQVCGKPLKSFSFKNPPSGFCSICGTKFKRKLNYKKIEEKKEENELKLQQEFSKELGKIFLNSNWKILLEQPIQQLCINWKRINKFKMEWNDILFLTKNIIPLDFSSIQSLRLTERLYLLKNNLKEIPKCSCGKERKFINFIKGYSKTCGNLECKIKYQAKKRIQTTFKKIKEKINEKYSEFELVDEYIGKNEFIKVKHKKCGTVFEKRFINGSYFELHCPTCEPYFNHSKIEYVLKDWLESLNIKVEFGKRFTFKNKTYELDLFLPEYNLGIEINGEFWHSLNHGTSKNYHLDKTEFFENNFKIQVLHFWHTEVKEKFDLVKSIILAKIGKFEKKIPARKTILKEISNKEYKEFSEENHLHGYSPATIKFGLFYQDELVLIAGFSKRGFKKDKKEWELIRFATKKNTQIIGGLSKIVKHFGKPFISFADRRISIGNVYKKIGMQFERATPPSLIGFKNGKFYHRFKFLNKKDTNKTQIENMIDEGFLVLFDCGNFKYKINRSVKYD